MVLSLGLRDSSAHNELQVLHASPIVVCKIFRLCAHVYVFFFSPHRKICDPEME